MAAGVFIKQRIVKQDARLVDGAVIRHERALAKVGRAFVHGDELLQQGLVRARVRLDGAAVLEADGEILDELALVRQRLRRIDNALGLAALRRNEALLRGQVGVKIAAADRVLPAAAKLRLGDHADGEVRAVGCMVLQRRDAEAVEVVAARLQVSIVRVPRGDGVVVHAAGVQNCLPELFDSAGLRLVGEHLFRPRHAGHGRDAPLVAALHLVAVGLDDAIAPLPGAGHLRGADTAQAVRIFAEQVDAARERVDIVLELRALPSLDGLERFDALTPDGELFERLVLPRDRDLARPGVIARIGDHGHELRLVELGLDDDVLPFLHTRADLRDQAGIGTQNGFFHISFPLFRGVRAA